MLPTELELKIDQPLKRHLIDIVTIGYFSPKSSTRFGRTNCHCVQLCCLYCCSFLEWHFISEFRGRLESMHTRKIQILYVYKTIRLLQNTSPFAQFDTSSFQEYCFSFTYSTYFIHLQMYIEWYQTQTLFLPFTHCFSHVIAVIANSCSCFFLQLSRSQLSNIISTMHTI